MMRVPDIDKISEINLRAVADRYRTQRVAFEIASEAFDQMKHSWRGNKDYLLAQLIRIVEAFIDSDKVVFNPRWATRTT